MENEIKTESKRRAAPGTTLLIDTGVEDQARSKKLQSLCHVDTSDGRILLIPQPSLTDPSDPLKWSPTKKWIVLLNGAFYAFMGSVTGPIMAAGESAPVAPIL
jgi:hypothetical protein